MRREREATVAAGGRHPCSEVGNRLPLEGSSFPDLSAASFFF